MEIRAWGSSSRCFLAVASMTESHKAQWQCASTTRLECHVREAVELSYRDSPAYSRRRTTFVRGCPPIEKERAGENDRMKKKRKEEKEKRERERQAREKKGRTGARA